MLLKIQILWLMLRMALKPGDILLIEKIRKALSKAGMFKDSVQYIERDPEARKTLLERPLLPADWLDLAYLRSLNEDTFGHQFARFVDKHQLDPHFSVDADMNSMEGYLHRRIPQIHDMLHVVLGQETDPLGELHLQAFLLAQVLWPMAPFLIGGWLLREMFRDLSQVPSVMSVISEGWRLGKIAKPLFAVTWETQWERPMDELRASLGLEGAGLDRLPMTIKTAAL